jgi:cell division protein FtsB
VAGALIAVCGWVAFAVYGQLVHGADLKSTVTALTQQNVVLQQQIADRETEISQAQSSAWLEEQARKLGYVLPGERIYVLTSPGAAEPSGGGVPATLPTFDPSPTPGATSTPSPTPSETTGPTPYTFTLSTPQPH